MKEQARGAWGWDGLEDRMGDLRLGLPMLRKNPVLTLVAVLTLGLGIGANTAIFTLLYGLVLRSLPAANPGQLVKVGVASRAELEQEGVYMTYPMLRVFEKEQTSFHELSGWSEDMVQMKDRDGAIRSYAAGLVSGNAFGLLGLQPYRGRLIAPYDDVKGGPSGGWPVVLSHGFWKDFYGGAEDIDHDFRHAVDGGRGYTTGFSRSMAGRGSEDVHAAAICGGAGKERRAGGNG
jgi:hypothetical protein